MQRVLVAVIAACFLFNAGWVAAQQTQAPRVPANPPIRSGADIGFRVEGKAPDGGVLGTLMVRLENGDWVEARGTPMRGHLVPLHSK
jgi:hypothetical protein